MEITRLDQTAKRLFREAPPVDQGVEFELKDTVQIGLELPENSDTRLLAGRPLLVTAQPEGLVARNADTGEEAWQYHPTRPGGFTWAASQDGEYLVVRQKNSLAVVDADHGTSVRELSLPPEADTWTNNDPWSAAQEVRFGPGHTVMANFRAIGRDGGRSWAEHNLAFYEVETGQGPEVVRFGDVGHLDYGPVVSRDGRSLYVADSYGLKSLDVGSREENWQRLDLRNIQLVCPRADGSLVIQHTFGLDVLEPEKGTSLATKKANLSYDPAHVLEDRILARNLLQTELRAYGMDLEEAWTLKLPEGLTFKHTMVTDKLVYATVLNEKDGYQARLLLIDPASGDVLAQSQPLGHLKWGLPLFQAENKVYLALQEGTIAFSPEDVQVDKLREQATQTPAGITVGKDFVQVGGIRLKARR